MLDLEAIKAKWLNLCGACDAGMGMCTHPSDDYRPVMQRLVDELERHYTLYDKLDQLEHDSEPVMLAAVVVHVFGDAGEGFPLAWPAIHAKHVRRALDEVVE